MGMLSGGDSPPGLPPPVLRGMVAGTLAFCIFLPNSSYCVSAFPRESLAPRGPLARKGHQGKM